VGRGGRNNAADVRLIQALLAPRLPAGATPLQVNGRVDQNLIDAIDRFQREVVGMARPDGRIDPGKRTFQMLTGAVPRTPSSGQQPGSSQPPFIYGPPFGDFGQGKPQAQKLSGSVGQGGNNNAADVRLVKTLLNAQLPIPAAPLQVNGQVDQNLISTIIHFQRQVLGMSRPDGRVDPGGRMFQALTGTTRQTKPPSGQSPKPPSGQSPKPPSGQPVAASDLVSSTRDFSFPFPSLPRKSYKSEGREFGANRDDGRKHAGCDLLFPEGTWILAVADGIVVRPAYSFYEGTDALEVLHGDIIVRYGELKSGSFVGGTTVKKGQKICKVGKLAKKKKSMLHIEVYKATARGQMLSVMTRLPYKRHKDLLDPTPFLDLWVKNLPVG
jgi:murein DD-endopeptidase MepM/ murein hydrolase activator NlpD